MNPKLTLSLLLLASSIASAAEPGPRILPPRPKLVLVLVIDQFRADYLLRFEKRFLPVRQKNGDVGGFSYLMTQGAYYPIAQYDVIQNMTCPGHATILTGAPPYQTGIPVNHWNDPATGESVYCAEDPNHKAIDAPQKAHTGTSPKNLLATTLGDELKNAGFGSRVVTLALKDRSAIMLGGHRADLAMWTAGTPSQWVSSTYYLKDGKLPDWMVKLNGQLRKRDQDTIHWKAEGEGTGLSDPTHRPYMDTWNLGPGFPHIMPVTARSALSTPYGLEVTTNAAQAAFDHYKLGRGTAPDLLGVSFASHDYMGHAFGPNSREMEEMTIEGDRQISRLLNHVRKNLPGGLKNVVIVLTADHGIAPDPDWAKAHGIDAGRINEKKLTEKLEAALIDKFGKPDGDKWVQYNHDFNIYLSRNAIAERKVELSAVLAEVKRQILTTPGAAYAVSLKDYEERKLPPEIYARQILKTYYPGRSGDVMLIPRSFYTVEDKDPVAHLTGYNYDSVVPLMLVGPGIKAGYHPEYARVVDIAPTLSFLTQVMPPSHSEGRVLSEALVSGPLNGATKR